MSKKIFFQNNIARLLALVLLGLGAVSCAAGERVSLTGSPGDSGRDSLVPVLLHVESGTVKRGMSGRFYPRVIVKYSDGSKLEGYVHSGFKKLKRNLELSFPPGSVTFKNGRFERIPNVADTVVSCRWTYREHGAAVNATSTVQVTGQPARLLVRDGQVKPGKRFYPMMEVQYSDGSKVEGFHHVFDPNRPVLLKMEPELVTFKNSRFELIPNAPDDLVMCHWEFTEGPVVVKAKSKVKVKDPHMIRFDRCISEDDIGIGAELSMIARCEPGISQTASVELVEMMFYCRPDLCNLVTFLGECCGSENTPPPVTLWDEPPFFTFECLKKAGKVRIAISFDKDKPPACYLVFPCRDLEQLMFKIEECCHCLM